MRFSSLSKSITRRGILMVSGLLAGSLLLSSCLDNLESPELPPAAYVTIFQAPPPHLPWTFSPTKIG